jgi:pimeloyl-ACP methyl ester carboxylesterase
MVQITRHFPVLTVALLSILVGSLAAAVPLSGDLLKCAEACLYAGGHYYSECKNHCLHPNEPYAKPSSLVGVSQRVVKVPSSKSSTSIFIYESKPPSSPKCDVSVIFVAGAGDSGVEYAALLRLLGAKGIRAMSYDRLGLARSSRTNLQRGATEMAVELHSLLKAAKIPPPYFIVGHSYAGIIVREYLQQYDDEVAGLLLLDANNENTLSLAIPDIINTVTANVDPIASTGLAQGTEITPRELKAFETYLAEATAEAEETGLDASGTDLAKYNESVIKLGTYNQISNHALGYRPLGIIMADVTRQFKELIAAGEQTVNVSAADQATLDAFVKALPAKELELQTSVLPLSSNYRMVIDAKTGHDVHLWIPSVVVQELDFMLASRNPVYKTEL